MNILLVKDSNLNLDLEQAAKILNTLTETVHFTPYDKTIDLASEATYIDFDRDKARLLKELADRKIDQVIYCTLRRYKNNYFFYSGSVTIISFFGWRHYTTLPIENGFFYFMAMILAFEIDGSYQHQDTTGCIYDFNWEKTGVDLGMKTGAFCQECLARIEGILRQSPSLQELFDDISTILDVLSKMSKLGKSVFTYNQKSDLLDWSSFEDEVSEIYRELGVEVKQDINLAGFQVDILLKERTPTKQTLSTIVECKFYKNKIGNRIVNDFARVLHTLKEANLVDKGIIVSYSGFTPDASLVAKETQVELVKFSDLKRLISDKKKRLSPTHRRHYEKPIDSQLKKSALVTLKSKEFFTKTSRETDKVPRLFTIIPFSTDMEDTYYLGIHETAKALGCICEKVDEIEFVGNILDKIYDSIKEANVIIAELSAPNTNVFYELGYSHGLGKPTILITKDISSTPFDVRGFNHIIYKNIRDLRKQLTERLQAILNI